MGLNTAMVVLNDHLHEIERDSHFGKKVAEAVRYAAGSRRQFTSGFSVLPTVHADTMQIVAVGGNTIRSLGFSHWSADDEDILRSLARDMGFRLVRMKKVTDEQH